ncbi:HIT family protein [Paenibacillus sp. LHD-117]|uniref:HIT family protein n=1 Tax=Paenibacillus sp. LHD-117 TaxID=3071412 RepID=UPI0027E0F457|nr:HIT family protein [Paenibacillus sp. LHD-117]MDQ6421752.1 HIT family protein [Paenibacillus sp. LHD-117]
MECLGCRLANNKIETNIVYEDEYVTCLLDIDPIHEGHTLILPKAHLTELESIDEVTLLAIMRASARIAAVLKEAYHPDGISIMQNGGLFNDLNHYHMHVFPRYDNDGFGWMEPTVSTSPRNSLQNVRDLLVRKLM